MAVGAGPFGEKFCELGDAMVGALVPNPCNSSGAESNHHIQVVPEERRGEERGGEGRGGPTVQDDEGQGGGPRRRREEREEDGRGGSLHRHSSSRSVRFHQS